MNLLSFQNGLLQLNPRNRFTAENYKRSLQDFIETVIEWFGTNDFDPEHVELGFGFDENVPAWKVPLDEKHSLNLIGRIDRVDILRDGSRAWCIVIDYKSGTKKPDQVLLQHGLQQQLPAYLLTVLEMKHLAETHGISEFIPGGFFFVPLTARYEGAKSRQLSLDGAVEARKAAYTHVGLYDAALLRKLDKDAPAGKSLQFQHRLKKDGTSYKGQFNALESTVFNDVLNRTRAVIQDIGRRIYEGDIAIAPYQFRKEVACTHCDYLSICRFDPWEQQYRSLKPISEEAL